MLSDGCMRSHDNHIGVISQVTFISTQEITTTLQREANAGADVTIKGHLEDLVQIRTGNDMLANVADMAKTVQTLTGGCLGGHHYLKNGL